MFGFARTLVQHKLLMVALLLAGYFLFAGEKEAPQPSSPWGANAPAQVFAGEPKKTSMSDKALALLNSAAKYAGVEGYLPTSLRDDAVANIGKTQNALTTAGQSSD